VTDADADVDHEVSAAAQCNIPTPTSYLYGRGCPYSRLALTSLVS
jgi:hypothetical protein